MESLDETRDRLGEKTVKRALFDALEEAGSEGLNIAALVDAVQVSPPSYHSTNDFCSSTGNSRVVMSTRTCHDV